MRIGLFVTCLIDLMRPEIGFSALKLLEAAGCDVVVPESQTCCGQPGYSAGDRNAARALAEKFVTEFEDFDYIVIPSGSCGGNVKVHYADLFSDDPAWHERMERLAPRVYELTDFLHSVMKLDKLPVSKSDCPLERVTYHDSCCGLRELGIYPQPRALLAKVPELEFVEMKDSRVCCGFGGTFSIKFGDISSAIVDEKCANIQASGADAVVLGDLGCMLNIEGRLRRIGDHKTKVVHVAQVLAGGRLMQVQSMHFKERAGQKLADQRLQQNLKKLSTKFVTGRAAAITELDDFEGTRDAAIECRMRAIENLDVWLATFEKEAIRRGATVLYAETAEDASRLVVEIARKHGVKKAIKSKSMVSEEMALNSALEAAGIQPIETDLGEYILQINGNEAPSHIIAPVVHKDKEEISDLFARIHNKPRLTDIPQMTREAREILRPQFLSADMGITGGNFVIAETGSVAIVTNEGNEGMCTVLPPKVHVVVTGIEKVLPTLEDFATIMRLLPRSATGQSISNYVSLLTGPKRQGDLDGPEHMYYVLVDAGRTSLIGSEFQDMLRCIRCGACMNHCPVYQKIGGHSYGWVYPGPMGSVLTPSYVGIENALDLPQASTLCGECHVVCPVKIPLPDLLRKLREKQVARHLRPCKERIGLTIWAYVAKRPKLYRVAAGIGVRFLRMIARGRKTISRLPFAAGWSDYRDMPAPSGKTFRELYRHRK